MHHPDRVTVPACIACGSMSRPGTCEVGCGAEERFDLIAAEDYDELVASIQACHARLPALRDVVRCLTDDAPADAEGAYRALQSRARAALRERPTPTPMPERARVFTTWRCPRCGGIDAPQPCLGVCVWRRVEWVPAERYDVARQDAERAAAEECRLRDVLRLAVAITPRPGHWERGWRAVARQVRDTADT